MMKGCFVKDAEKQGLMVNAVKSKVIVLKIRI